MVRPIHILCVFCGGSVVCHTVPVLCSYRASQHFYVRLVSFVVFALAAGLMTCLHVVDERLGSSSSLLFV